ncbi:MAG: hypothetical protein ABSB83_06955 [Methanomassiliicoccales archaeon]|jgi:hypothetical protein
MTFAVAEASIRGDVESEVQIDIDRERTIDTSIPAIDAFVEGFRSSQITFIDSSDRMLFDLIHTLCINSIHSLEGEIVWVDGGNSINPYELAGLCKRFRMDMGETLDCINISRAFTAYQMVTLIADALENEVEQTGSELVIVSCFPDLFLDRDMWWSESFQLMKHCISTLQSITRKHNTVTILTNYGLTKMLYKKSLRTVLYGSADKILRIENKKYALLLSLVKEGRAMLYHPVPYYQMTLDEFWG